MKHSTLICFPLNAYCGSGVLLMCSCVCLTWFCSYKQCHCYEYPAFTNLTPSEHRSKFLSTSQLYYTMPKTLSKKNVCTNAQPICFVRVPVILHPCQNFTFLDLFIFASLVGVKWLLIVVSIGISLVTKEVETPSYNYEPFIKISAYVYHQFLGY